MQNSHREQQAPKWHASMSSRTVAMTLCYHRKLESVLVVDRKVLRDLVVYRNPSFRLEDWNSISQHTQSVVCLHICIIVSFYMLT